ncbi:LLM class flavin-dependent oxidoreductase [Saccharopolyspora sp. K220]|uniref:LLM class flavin-dependent oxidoreductase n=1 Tax=Saccharopolyspora soli TaxID=2926618 RepID=UPI001F571892|nr:LLM class flavin-dependent oxidoreductase [Saccharopolyspora soli]MCI2423852.1 LLM class flavin-dependent oxidoreductase [Saccharopolyspora soli]
MTEVKFGALLDQSADRAQDVVGLAELMEQLGYDVVTLSDHPYWPERLDTIALLSTLVARTRRITVMPNLLNLPLRPPAMVARTAATLDILSGGRFELGLGAGAQQMWESIVAEGGPMRTAGQSIEALEEATYLIRALWTSKEDVEFRGGYYRLGGARPGPPPLHEISIWFGAYQPRMLRVVGAIGNGWISSSPFFPPEALPNANRVIDEAAQAAGRSPQSIRRGYNIEGEFGAGSGFLQGPPTVWAQQLAELVLAGQIDTFFLFQASSPDFLRRFAAEVAPAVRELVAKD